MAKTTYHGSCHCKAITFEADIDFATTETGKCNCTYCWKHRWWSVKVPLEDFRSLTGDGQLSKGNSGWCPTCGVIPYGFTDQSDWNPTAYWSVGVYALDDLDPAVLVAAPVRYFDGLNDNWWHPPTGETRHL